MTSHSLGFLGDINAPEEGLSCGYCVGITVGSTSRSSDSLPSGLLFECFSNLFQMLFDYPPVFQFDRGLSCTELCHLPKDDLCLLLLARKVFV